MPIEVVRQPLTDGYSHGASLRQRSPISLAENHLGPHARPRRRARLQLGRRQRCIDRERRIVRHRSRRCERRRDRFRRCDERRREWCWRVGWQSRHRRNRRLGRRGRGHGRYEHGGYRRHGKRRQRWIVGEQRKHGRRRFERRPAARSAAEAASRAMRVRFMRPRSRVRGRTRIRLTGESRCG